jgi:hypothetical protein
VCGCVGSRRAEPQECRSDEARQDAERHCLRPREGGVAGAPADSDVYGQNAENLLTCSEFEGIDQK